MNLRLNTSAMLTITVIVLALLFAETSYAGSGSATPGSFSQKQIANIVNTVTTEIELSKNWKANFTNTAGTNLYCDSVVLGEGIRAGKPGVYTWFTCSAMHKLNMSATSNPTLTCTGFSSPMWITPKDSSIKFQTVSYGPEYLAFRNSAPAPIQSLMDSHFNQITSRQPRVIVARATSGSIPSSKVSAQNNCQ